MLRPAPAAVWEGRSDPATAVLLLAPLAGAAFVYLAFNGGPLLPPAVLLTVTAIAATLARPALGVAVALLLIPLGPIASRGLGVVEWETWLPAAIWAIFLLAVAALRAPSWPARFPLSLGVSAYVIAAIVSLMAAQELANWVSAARALAVGITLFIATSLAIRGREDVRWVMRAVAFVASAVGALAIIDYVSGSAAGGAFVTGSGDLVGRISAGFAHPNQLGGFLALLVPFTVAGAILDGRYRLLYTGAIAVAVIATYVTFSRSALLALALVPLFFVRGRRLAVVVPMLAVLVVFATPDLLRERFATLTDQGTEVAQRVDIWQTSFALWTENPVTGVGPGGFPEAYAHARVPDKAFLPTTVFEPPPHAHNLFLQHLAELGLLGLTALVALLVAAMRRAIALRRSADPWSATLGTGALATLAIFLFHNQFDVTFVGETGAAVWVMLGIVSALAGSANDYSSQARERGGSRRGLPAGAAA